MNLQDLGPQAFENELYFIDALKIYGICTHLNTSDDESRLQTYIHIRPLQKSDPLRIQLI